MGASQQQSCEVWLTVEKNSTHIEKDIFDFIKDRTNVSSNRVSFPSSLNLNPTNNLLQYTLLQDPLRELFTLNMTSSNEVSLRLSKREQCPSIWRYLCENEVIELEQGDTIKLGRVELYLKELKFIQGKTSKSKIGKQEPVSIKPQNSYQMQRSSHRDSYSPLKNSSHFGKSSGFFGKHQRHMRQSDLLSLGKSIALGHSGVSTFSHNEKSCRICFDSHETTTNPLFNVCLCTGSVKYVHFQCLKSWFRSKTVKYQTPHCLYFCYQPLSCQICKYSISNSVVHDGRKYCLYQYEQIHPPFAKFQHAADGKIFQVLIRLEESLNINVGRGAQNDLNLNDSSISRSHCVLEFSSQRLFLRAFNCRYGTFVELQGNIEFGEGPIGLNVSNYMLWLDRRVKASGFAQCCDVESKGFLVVK